MMQRVEERVTAADGPVYARRVFTMLETLTAANSYAERFVVRLHGKILVIPVAEVDWIKAEDNYIRIHTGSSSYLDRETLSSLRDRLDPRKFVRVHRSALINVDRIKEVTVINGEYELVLQSGIRIALSRTYRDEFFSRLGDPRPASPGFKKR
jgi:two-component system LytT family response regulator